jgi:hypothetical protein
VDPCWWYAGLTDLAQLCAETPPAAVGQPCSSDAECLPFATLTAVDGTVVRQLLVCDTGTQTCAAATTVPPRIDLYECRVLVAGFPCTPGAVLGCIGSSLARCAPSGATVALEACPYGCEPDRGACDECPIDTRYCDGNTLIECDGSGQLSTKTCPYGCDASSTSLCY